MNILQALDLLKQNRCVARPGWGHRVYLILDGELILHSHNGYDTIWQPPHPDLFASDWVDVIPHP